MPGLRLEAVEATKVVFFFGVVLVAFFLSSLAVELVETFESPLWFTAVLPDEARSASLLSSSDPEGETNRVLGRGPEFEGPLGFFKMGCGCFVEDDGVDFVAFDLPFDLASDGPALDVSGIAAWTLAGSSAFDSGDGFIPMVSTDNWSASRNLPVRIGWLALVI